MKHAHRVNMQFVYVPAASTNVAKTIAKEKKRLAELKAKAEAVEAEAQMKVRRIAK